jgi:predicted ArsR family transcriptional regulator
MKETYTLKTLEQIKIMAQPLRMQLLEAFSHEPMTTKQVAQLLKEHPTKLYHHVEALERVGIIKLVRTQRKRGTTEKYYQAVARHFTVDGTRLELATHVEETIDELQMMAQTMFQETLSEVRQSIADEHLRSRHKRNPAILAHSYIYTTPEQIAKLTKKIRALLKECESVKQQQGVVGYGLTVAFYPVKKRGTRKGGKKTNTKIRERSKK